MNDISNTSSVKFEYKCRRCGDIMDNLETSYDRAYHDLIRVSMYGGGVAGMGITLRIHDIHHCADGGMGITDLLGFSVVE